MSHVWILSEGEKYEGERVIAVYADYDKALDALQALADQAGCDDVKVDWTNACFYDGIFYSIIRQTEVQS